MVSRRRRSKLEGLAGKRTPEDVRALVSRAGIVDVERAGPGALATAPVLVFCGEWRKSLAIYGHDGVEIGSATRSKDRYSEVGYRYHYELGDTKPRCVMRDITRRRLGISSRSYTFGIWAAQGGEIGTIARGRGLDDYVIARGGQPAATVRRLSRRDAWHDRRPAGPPTLRGRAQQLADRLGSSVWIVEDAFDCRVARLTYLLDFNERVAYVLELDLTLDEHLRMMVLTVCLVADNRIVDCTPGG